MGGTAPSTADSSSGQTWGSAELVTHPPTGLSRASPQAEHGTGPVSPPAWPASAMGRVMPVVPTGRQ